MTRIPPVIPAKRRLLFVDDEPCVLDGLRDLLRGRRREWEMVFAGSAEAALAELEKQPFDVVVSDMRMPVMDGAQLLRAVQQRWPGTVRLILSGHTDQEAADRAIGVAHQFLTKPCDAGTLAETIERTLRVIALLDSDALRGSVGRVQSLPARPRVHASIVEKLRDENATNEDIASLLEQDMGLVARVLQMSNSGFFGLPRRITRLADAVGFLGQRTVQNLALATAVYGSDKPLRGIDTQALQKHARHVGSLARRLVDDKHLVDDAFVAGLLHDLGIILLASSLPEHFAQSLAELARAPRPLHEVEYERWGVSHAEIGAYLLGLWNLPLPLVEAVAQHHRPDSTRPASELATVLHVADALAHEYSASRCAVESASAPALDLVYLEAIGSLDRVEAWRDIARELQATLEEAA